MQQYLIINHPSSVVCHLSSVICPRTSTSVENALQISSFMQNKPNFGKAKMNINVFPTKDYKNKSNWTLGESKPNSNPISKRMNVNFYAAGYYESKPTFAVRKARPNNPKGRYHHCLEFCGENRHARRIKSL